MSYTFGYQSLYSNGLNNNTQIRRSVDMIYQRGGNYNIILTGDTYVSSMELDVDLYSNDVKVGRMSLVPYNVTTGATNSFIYKFNLRPYDYLSNYIQSQHYTGYTKNDFYTTNLSINYNNPYPNSTIGSFKYGYRYITGGTSVVYETSYQDAGEPVNELYHFSALPYCISDTSFVASGMTNTGPNFDYIGGSFQMGTDKFYLPNFDQELGTVIGTSTTIPSSIYRRLSPASHYLMDYPTVPEMSQTGRFLTDAPRIQYVQSDENYVLYYINGQTGDRQVIEADYAVIEFFNSNNVKITGSTINQQLNYAGTTYASPTGYTDTTQIFALPCGPSDLTNLYSSLSLSGVTYYTVQLFYSYPTNSESRSSVGPIGPVSEQFYFYLYNNCQPENTRLSFLNARGGYDYFTFTSFRNDTKKISAQTYDSRYYSTDLAGPDRDYGRSVKTYATDLNQEIILESNYLSVPMGNWLEQLFYSPQVYIMDNDFISPMNNSSTYYKDLTPVQVLSTEVETITKKHRKLNKYRITLKTADSFFVNRGF
jgi:hypothetical protein